MANTDTSNWEVRGWQGVVVTVPPEWDIAAISGDGDQGYMRLDDIENMPRVEIKWQKAKGFVDIDGVVDKYLTALGRKRKKGEPEIEVDRDCAVVSRRRMRHKRDLNCFAWHGATDGFGAGWYCEECERVMVVQVLALPDEDGLALAGEVIGNLQDHPEDEWITWSTYGLQMQAPEHFTLSGQKLMAGLIELQFEDKGEQIIASRWGMANVALKDGSLRRWAQREIPPHHKGVKLSYEDTTFRGHPAVEVSGYFANPLRHVQAFAMHVVGKPYPEAVKGWVWHSQEENRIYYAGVLVDEDRLELAEQVARRIACPEADQSDSEREEPIR